MSMRKSQFVVNSNRKGILFQDSDRRDKYLYRKESKSLTPESESVVLISNSPASTYHNVKRKGGISQRNLERNKRSKDTALYDGETKPRQESIREDDESRDNKLYSISYSRTGKLTSHTADNKDVAMITQWRDSPMRCKSNCKEAKYNKRSSKRNRRKSTSSDREGDYNRRSLEHSNRDSGRSRPGGRSLMESHGKRSQSGYDETYKHQDRKGKMHSKASRVIDDSQMYQTSDSNKNVFGNSPYTRGNGRKNPQRRTKGFDCGSNSTTCLLPMNTALGFISIIGSFTKCVLDGFNEAVTQTVLEKASLKDDDSATDMKYSYQVGYARPKCRSLDRKKLRKQSSDTF